MKKLEIQYLIKAYIDMKKASKFDQDNFLMYAGKYFDQEDVSGLTFSKENHSIDGITFDVLKENKIVARTLIGYDLNVHYIKYFI